jgi:hypothetical protein
MEVLVQGLTFQISQLRTASNMLLTPEKTILREFPGKVHTVWCYANKPGDHGRGLALDLMVKACFRGYLRLQKKDSNFVEQNRDPIGRTMAEWIMNNHSSLRVKYVIWGQKIWNVEVDKTPKAWTSWRGMEDRGDDTANHW